MADKHVHRALEEPLSSLSEAEYRKAARHGRRREEAQTSISEQEDRLSPLDPEHHLHPEYKSQYEPLDPRHPLHPVSRLSIDILPFVPGMRPDSER